MKEKFKNKKKEITIIFVITLILLFFFSGFSMGKGYTKKDVKGNAEIAKPILEVENAGNLDRTFGGMRDTREGRSGMSRRFYMEAKEIHSDNTPESKQAKMRELEKYMRSLSDDLTEAIDGASNEEKNMLKSKLATLAQKIV